MNNLGHPWSARVVGTVEAGQRDVSVDELGGLAVVLRVRIRWLLGYPEDST